MRVAIVGGGISGLSLAYFLIQRAQDAEIVLLESEPRPGGKILTEKNEGFLCEGGVNGFLDNRPRTLDLSRMISLDPLRSNDAARKRFVYSGGVLHRLPESPPAFLASRLLSLPGRLRVAAEVLIPGKAMEAESLADFATRRLGKEAYEKLIDPMASGIYAGNPETLSLRACFPKVYDLERKYGGLIRGMIRLQRERKRSGSAEKVGAGPGGVLTSYYQGMGALVDGLRGIIGDRLRLGRGVRAIDRKGQGYSLLLADGTATDADVVVIATPAFAAADILKEYEPGLAKLLSGITYPSVAVACLGYRREKIKSSLDGFGFLVPSGEKRSILGTLFDSSIFPNRAPEGQVLLRSMVGGARASDLACQKEERIVDLVKRELADILSVRTDPDFVKVFRWEAAIPQYTLGHLDRLKDIDGILAGHRNLYLAGNAYRGIGVNDCIENSFLLTEKIVEQIRGKGVQ